MLAATFILAFTIVAGFIEMPAMIRSKMKKEAWIFAVLLLVGTILSIALALNVKLPNPMVWISAVYRPLSDVVNQALK